MTELAHDLNEEIGALEKRRSFEAAVTLFHRDWYRQTMLDDVAKSLKATKPLVYNRYRNKAGPLYEICSKGIEDSLIVCDERMAGAVDSAERLRRVVLRPES
jgi:AcrR family transcriptional regulator